MPCCIDGDGPMEKIAMEFRSKGWQQRVVVTLKEKIDDFGVHHMQWGIQTISGKVGLLSLMMVKDFRL